MMHSYEDLYMCKQSFTQTQQLMGVGRTKQNWCAKNDDKYFNLCAVKQDWILLLLRNKNLESTFLLQNKALSNGANLIHPIQQLKVKSLQTTQP